MKLSRYLVAVLMTAVPAICAASSTGTSCEALAPRVQALLLAYSHKDVAGTLKLSDPDTLLVLGTDLSEVADTGRKVQALLQADFALWGSAEFGGPKFMSCRVGDSLATAAFDVPFTMHRGQGHADTMTIRFLTVWHKSGGHWLLTQSLNSVPTVGQSARDILKRSARSL